MKHQDNTLTLIFSIVDDFCKLHLEAVEKHPLFSHLSIRYNKDRQNKRKRRGKCAM